jgi:hypothetical protein
MADLPQIVRTVIRHRATQYWHKPGTFEAALHAAQMVGDQDVDRLASAIEREITAREFRCDFDDPCDAWAA